MDQVRREQRSTTNWAQRGHRWLCVWIVTVGFLLARFPSPSSGQQPMQPPSQSQPRSLSLPSEYEVKAAYLLNFTKFIEWPKPPSNDADPYFSICIFGEDPFGGVLDQIVEGERVDHRAIRIRRLGGTFSGACRILYVGRSDADIQRLLSLLPAGVLTVGDNSRFLEQGGMIELAVENRRVRFDVDVRAAARSGLRVSSRLLNVARRVENQERP